MSQTTAGTTSGRTLRENFNVAKVMEHAYRRAGYLPQKITAEWAEVARELLFLQLSEYMNFGFPLWTRREYPLAISIGSGNVQLPYGTIDAMGIYWRQFQPWRGEAVLSTGENANALVAGMPTDDVGIRAPNPGVIVQYEQATQTDMIGVLPAPSTGWLLDGNGEPILDDLFNPILATPSSYTAQLEVLTSEDGLRWINSQTLPEYTFEAGKWAYFDLDPSITTPWIQIILPGNTAWMIQQVNFVQVNSQQIDLGRENIDDWYNLPDRFFQGSQPNTAYVDRVKDSPIVKIWPTPNQGAFYNGTVVALARCYIQDPGELTDTLDVPARWFWGVLARLAVRLMDELPVMKDAQSNPQESAVERAQRRQNCETDAAKAEAGFWSEERDPSPIRIIPNISPYTR